jgi:GMP synthase (glutamine-hydrolysing)
MFKKMLIIKTGSTVPSLLEKGEDFEDWIIEGSGLKADRFQTSSVHLGEKLPDINSVSGIIITGSPAYLTDLEQWNFIAAEYLHQAYQLAIPMLGICYGHQLIAWAFGGEVDFHPRGREIGTVQIELTGESTADLLLKNPPDVFPVQASHQQTVCRLPPEAILLAANEFDPHHCFRLGACTWGVQFHPEFSAEVIAEYILARQQAITEEGLDAAALLDQLQASPESAALLKQCARIVDGEA